MTTVSCFQYAKRHEIVGRSTMALSDGFAIVFP